MAIKPTIHEQCERCGERDARVIGTMITVGHSCRNAPPGPSDPPRRFRIDEVNFVLADFSKNLLRAELDEAWCLIEDLRSKRWRAEASAIEAVRKAMRGAYDQ